MKEFNAYFPTKLVVGTGRISEVGTEMALLGTKVFGVFDPFLKDSEILGKIRQWLKESGLSLVEFYDVVPNPRYQDMDRGAALCVENGCDCVLAIGGGSAIDTAKAITLAAKYGGSTWDYTKRYFELDKVKEPKQKGLPMLAVPTTAGTGAEATLSSVVNNQELHVKCSIINPVLFPNTSIIDASMMYSVPPMLTALTGLDTFSHAFESYISTSANEFSEMLSLKSMELFVRSIRTAVHEPTNKEAREDMALASALAGAAFCQASLCLPHAIAQPVGGLRDVPHGATLAICMPPIIKWTLPYGQEKFAKVAELLDPSVRDLPLEQKAQAIVPLFEQLYQDLGVTVKYGDYGLTEADIPELTDIVFDYYKWDLGGHPKPVTREDVEEIYRQCM